MIYFFLILIVAVIIIEAYSLRKGGRQISYDVKPSDYLVEPGKKFFLELKVRNNSKFPVFWLKAKCSVPEELELAENMPGILEIYGKHSEYSLGMSLKPHAEKNFNIEMSLPSRGLYRFSNFSLSVGDFLGIRTRIYEFPGSSEIVVMPEKANDPDLSFVTGGIMGEYSVNRWIYEDPILTAGFREYTGSEPQRAISWTRSLQSDRIMVKQFDHTTERKLNLIFYMPPVSSDSHSHDKIEASLSLCRSVCEYLTQKSVPFALYHTGCLYTSIGRLEHVSSGLGGVHLERILEALGRFSETSVNEEAGTLLSDILKMEYDASCCLIITPMRTPEISDFASRLGKYSNASVFFLQADMMEVKL